MPLRPFFHTALAVSSGEEGIIIRLHSRFFKFSSLWSLGLLKLFSSSLMMLANKLECESLPRPFGFGQLMDD
jgi:hypothetical protein